MLAPPMARGSRSKGKHKSRPRPKPGAPTTAPARTVPREIRRRGVVEVLGGSAMVLAGFLLAAFTFDPASNSGGKFIVAYGPVLVGLLAIATGAIRLSPKTEPGAPRPDVRRWIYGGLAVLFAVIQAACVIWVIPNRLPSAWLHLWSFPFFTTVMAIGTLAGRRAGWWVAVLSGTAVLVSTAIVIVRILISAAFLAGVYGAFGKAAATFSFVAVALIVQAVALLPIVHIKFLMSRVGKRAYGV
jgi:hypothetical protein